MQPWKLSAAGVEASGHQNELRLELREHWQNHLSECVQLRGVSHQQVIVFPRQPLSLLFLGWGAEVPRHINGLAETRSPANVVDRPPFVFGKEGALVLSVQGDEEHLSAFTEGRAGTIPEVRIPVDDGYSLQTDWLLQHVFAGDGYVVQEAEPEAFLPADLVRVMPRRSYVGEAFLHCDV